MLYLWFFPDFGGLKNQFQKLTCRKMYKFFITSRHNMLENSYFIFRGLHRRISHFKNITLQKSLFITLRKISHFVKIKFFKISHFKHNHILDFPFFPKYYTLDKISHFGMNNFLKISHFGMLSYFRKKRSYCWYGASESNYKLHKVIFSQAWGSYKRKL